VGPALLVPTSYIAPAQSAREDARLIDVLHDKSARVRRHAAEFLSGLGPAATVPDLVRFLHDPDAGVRGDAANTLGFLDPAAGARERLQP
jgi:HEAT repeat protein